MKEQGNKIWKANKWSLSPTGTRVRTLLLLTFLLTLKYFKKIMKNKTQSLRKLLRIKKDVKQMKPAIYIWKAKLHRREKVKLNYNHTWRNNKQNKIKLQFRGAILSFLLIPSRKKKTSSIMKPHALVWVWPARKFFAADKLFCADMLLIGTKWPTTRRNSDAKSKGSKGEKSLRVG